MVEITVLMAVYDPPIGMLSQAVDSILGQSLSDFEFLIVDDGSRDRAALDYLAARASVDSRIRLVREPHRGLTPSLNRGLELANGRWIARQDADDWSAPQRLETQLAFLAANPGVALCGSNAWTHQRGGYPLWRTRLPLTHSELVAEFPRGNPFVHGATMFSRQHANTIGGYREAFPCSQDYDFFWRLSETGQVANLAEALYHYRYTAGSISAGRAVEQEIDKLAARKLAIAREARRNDGNPRPETSDEVRAALDAAEQEILDVLSGALRTQLRQADHLLLAGDYCRALRAYLELAMGHPASALVWGKLARCGLFLAVPTAREACFR